MYRHITPNTEPIEGAVVVIPARYHVNNTSSINAYLKTLSWAVVILTSDEESLFPWHRLNHPHMRVWVQSPRKERANSSLRYLPLGSPSHGWDVFPSIAPKKMMDVYFAGQVNHQRRDDMVEAFSDFPNAYIDRSPGFTLGLPRETYLNNLAISKVAPCPSGPSCAESFRVWEAIESGAIPIVDEGPKPDAEGRAISGYPPGFWSLLLDRFPFPVVKEWSQAPAVAEKLLAAWPGSGNRVSAWWQMKKRELRLQLLDDVKEVMRYDGGPDSSSLDATVGASVTCVIPTSPTPNNPDTSHIDAVIASIRNYTDAEILVMIDGVSLQQEHLREGYEEYVRRVLWQANHLWSDVVPLLFEESLHQSGKLIRTLPYITTPLIFWNEHDTPLEGDINWESCCEELLEDNLDLIRFYHESAIHPEHEHLMGGNVTPWLVQTMQQSGRPHLARTDYYRRIMKDHFTEASRTFIEWTMHSVCQDFPDEHRMALYAPPGENIRRSHHLDARGSEPTYEELAIP